MLSTIILGVQISVICLVLLDFYYGFMKNGVIIIVEHIMGNTTHTRLANLSNII